MNMTDKQRADVVRTLREAAERMVVHSLSGMCVSVLACNANFFSEEYCREALNWLRRDSPDSSRPYWYADAFREHEARAFALDMLASIIEAGDSLE
jgi:hypothetical protein